MKALASLSKYLGYYDEWRKIIQRYQLKWSDSNRSLQVFRDIFDGTGHGLSHMVKWVREAIDRLPKEYGNILFFNTLTGLRPDEAQKALHLIKTKDKEYIDRDKGMLKHYQFPDTFLRQTKKAYVSIVNEDILNIAKKTPERERYYNGLRKRLNKQDLKMNMYYCRKVFATYLMNKGIEPEIIDLLQGRISSSVFVNYYYRPDINEMIANKIRPALNSLSKVIETVK
jgi:intergrase/recombinase